jgi:hypothetical protein
MQLLVELVLLPAQVLAPLDRAIRLILLGLAAEAGSGMGQALAPTVVLAVGLAEVVAAEALAQLLVLVALVGLANLGLFGLSRFSDEESNLGFAIAGYCCASAERAVCAGMLAGDLR